VLPQNTDSGNDIETATAKTKQTPKGACLLENQKIVLIID